MIFTVALIVTWAPRRHFICVLTVDRGGASRHSNAYTKLVKGTIDKGVPWNSAIEGLGVPGTMKTWELLGPVILTLASCSKPIPADKVPRGTPTANLITLESTKKEPPPSKIFDMVEVKGRYCTDLRMRCLRWLDPKNPGVNGPVQCAEFEFPTVCVGKEVPMHFFIDRFEYPNVPGVLPETNLSWTEVKKDCEASGKRLCTESEWSLACEGPERKPYPYGYHRNPKACNIDRPWIDPFQWRNPLTHQIIKPTPFEILDQRVPSGSMPDCVSDYGVYDMTGNVDEWVVHESGRPFRSSLKGGHWASGARNRCRPTTDAHNESFTFYETSSRCCKDL